MRNHLVRLWGMMRDASYFFRNGDIPDPDQSFVERFRHLLYNRIEWIVLTRSLEEPLPAIKSRVEIDYSVATAADLSRLRDIVFPSRLSYFRKRLEHGRTCIFAIHQGRVVAYCWATGELNSEIDNLELRLKPGDAYTDDLYTVPEFRRHRIGTATNLSVLNYLQERGFKRAVKIVRENNNPALRMDEKLGFLESDHLVFRRILTSRDYHYAKGEF